MAAVFRNHLPMSCCGDPKSGVIGDQRFRSKRPAKHNFRVTGAKFELDVKYAPIEVLGNGSYGVVCSCMNLDTGEKVAVKKIGEALDDTLTALCTLREIQILRRIRHHNVISLKDVMVSSSPAGRADFKQVYLVQELMDADLGGLIGSLTGDQSKYLLFQILNGLEFLHSAHVIHRDLKPQNLLVNSKNDLKICDFGLSRTKSSTAQSMTQYMTSRWYRAPEILLSSKQYGSEVDMWSVGCIFAEMLSGDLIFRESNCLDQIRRIHSVLGTQSASELKFIDSKKVRKFLRELPFSTGLDLGKLIPTADPLAIDLLKKMLVLNPKRRISALDALKHPYLAEIYDPSSENSEMPVKPVRLYVDEYPGAVEESLLRDLIWEEMLQFHPEQR